MNERVRVAGEGLTKVFNRRTVFEGVSFSIESGQTLLITGRNGSGKSTLVKLISGVLTPSSGRVVISGTAHQREMQGLALIGMVSPYLQMFEEFSARENLEIAMGIRGREFNNVAADELLERVALSARRNDPVRTYSSGMKQRVKYAFALLHRPPILILDEPMANLDEDGIGIVRSIMAEHRAGGILIVATNDMTDIDRHDLRVDLNEPR
jgi:heme exporter protein A